MEQRSRNENLSKGLILLMSIACGVIVANLYYSQPLLELISHFFQVSQASASLISTLTQIGYALGLLIILPFADTVEKKRLILSMIIPCLAGLFFMYLSKNFYFSCLLSLTIGFSSVTPQLLIPLATQLTPEAARGSVIGNLMSGLLTGILLSRVMSGLMGSLFAWQTIYVVAFSAIVLIGILLAKYLPVSRPVIKISYQDSMKSLLPILKKYPQLGQVSFIGSMAFCCFSAFWITLTFFLADAYHLGASVAGSLGIIGLVGAIGSNLIGKSSDKRGAKFTIKISLWAIIGAFVLLAVIGYQFWGLILGIILLDFGVQSCNVSCMAVVHKLNNEIRSRVTAIYMFSYFVGGAFGSFIGTHIYQMFGWLAVCLFCLVLQAFAVLMFLRLKTDTIENS